ncbi:Hypothetical protein DHA2_7244 [Giardia duodenalis]|uniref:Uncharacterized protein n=1 Tax=Giardia intestinalis TaxID=5741 RepID=V6TIX3_GIAIN|nr:Hypothetical protein DHA2_7244 [Giardia intestinalis]
MPSKCPLRDHIEKLKTGIAPDDLARCKTEVAECVSKFKTPVKIFLGGVTYEHLYAVVFNAVISVIVLVIAWSLPQNALFNVCLIITLLMGAKFVFQHPIVESKLGLISGKLGPGDAKLDMLVDALAALRARRIQLKDTFFNDNKKVLALLAGLAFLSFFISTPVIVTVVLVVLNLVPFYVRYVVASHKQPEN